MSNPIQICACSFYNSHSISAFINESWLLLPVVVKISYDITKWNVNNHCSWHSCKDPLSKYACIVFGKNRSSQASFVLLICILIFCVHRMQQSLAAAERAFLISLTHLVMNRDCLWRTRMYYQLAAYTRHHPGI